MNELNRPLHYEISRLSLKEKQAFKHWQCTQMPKTTYVVVWMKAGYKNNSYDVCFYSICILKALKKHVILQIGRSNVGRQIYVGWLVEQILCAQVIVWSQCGVRGELMGCPRWKRCHHQGGINVHRRFHGNLFSRFSDLLCQSRNIGLMVVLAGRSGGHHPLNTMNTHSQLSGYPDVGHIQMDG